jgi:protein-L-isoaspartate(D-aspartate) O-methyltransferase
MPDYSLARRNMVESQVRPNKVVDARILQAMLEVPRERFVGARLRGIAYIDEDLPLGDGRYLIEPMLIGRLLQGLAVKSGDVVLDVGCATGYSSALLAKLASTVVALECRPDFAAAATRNLAELGVDNAIVVEGALPAGYDRQAPYDAILVGGSVSRLPEPLCAQLSEGGRLCVVLRAPEHPGKAVLVVNAGGVLSRREMFDANTPLLPGFEAETEFVF